jgi:type II secretory pathway component PulM
MKKKKISSVLIYLFCCALVLLAYMSYVYTPLSKAINRLDQKHDQLQTQIDEYRLQEAQKSKLISQIKELKSQIAMAENEDDVVTDKNVEEDIDTACRTAGVSVTSLDLNKETADASTTNADGRPLLSLSVDLEISCTDAQLQTLLNYFEQESKGTYYVKSVSFQKDTDISNAKLSLLLYYFGTQETKK